jgi:hypothetical protein
MNPIVQLAASAIPGSKKYVLFAGAGVSKDAGIPTAWDLVLKTASLLYAAENQVVEKTIDLEKWFLNSRYAKMSYPELIEKLYPSYPEQQAFLKEFLNNKQSGETHDAIAELARRGIIRAIITTNFDKHIEKALEAKGIEVQTISSEEDLIHSEPLIQCQAFRIYKPHGDLGKGQLRNTPKDVETLPPRMEAEILRVMNEHGVIVLGYSGCDPGIRSLFEKRSSNFYPVFWVDPKYPDSPMGDIIKSKSSFFIKCEKAKQFLKDYFGVMDRLKQLAPAVSQKVTIYDLKDSLSNSNIDIEAIAKDFLESLFKRLETIKPDFSQFRQRDDAILEQINKGMEISAEFIEACLIISRFKNKSVAKIFFEFFGNMLTLYDIPEGFSGTFTRVDFDGCKFLGYEMFVGFIASLIRYGNWEMFSDILSEGIFIRKRGEDKYVDFVSISSYVGSLDEVRNQRLNLNRTSIMSDIIKERFSNKTPLAQLLTHREFMEADYFLFLRTVCQLKDLQSLWGTWCPRSCVYSEGIVPSYIAKSESRRFLNLFGTAMGFTIPDNLTKLLVERHKVIEKFFPNSGLQSPLCFFDFQKIGSRP